MWPKLTEGLQAITDKVAKDDSIKKVECRDCVVHRRAHQWG